MRRNAQRLEAEVIPRVRQWAQESGTVFEEDKTGLVHFSYRRNEEADQASVTFNSVHIQPSSSIKVLGLELDAQLRMVDHVAKKAAKAIRACSQMQRIKGLRPKQKRQLYRSIILPVVDYAAPVWHASDFRGGGQKIRLLNQVQRLGARQILRAFKTTALPVLEVEASLDPVIERLHRRAVQQVVAICLGPDGNPAKQLVRRLKDQPGRMWSPARTTFEHIRQRLQGRRRPALSPEPVWIQPPWEDFTSMVEIAPKDEARAAAKAPTQNGRYPLFTDGSVNNGVSGGAVVQGYRGQLQTLCNGTI